MKRHIASLDKDAVPMILEVGIDRGVTLIPLTVFLSRIRKNFVVLGVDVLVQEQLAIMVNNLDLLAEQQCYLVQKNSLEILPELANSGMKFDLILLDGDHNYHTVNKELSYIDSLTHAHSIVIIDDYDGRWSTKDLWYAERPGYEDVGCATQRIDSDKHGVKPAVDEFISNNHNWVMSKPLQGEPIVLTRVNTNTTL